MSKEDTKDSNYKVFISHSSEDLPEAKNIARWCKDIGLSTWVDEEEIKIGESWREKIAGAIEESQFVIVLISKEALKSKWMSREWDVLCEEKWSRPDIKILPIKWEDVKSPPFLCEYKDLHIKKNKGDYKLIEESILRFLKDTYGDTHKVIINEDMGEELKRLKDRIKSIKSTLTDTEGDEQGGHQDDQT